MTDDNKKPNAKTQSIPSSVNPDAKPVGDMSPPECYECEEPITEGQPMTQVRQGFCDGETVGSIDGSIAEGDIDYVINYHAQCYANSILAHVPETTADQGGEGSEEPGTHNPK